jgi:hypothetical protein
MPFGHLGEAPMTDSAPAEGTLTVSAWKWYAVIAVGWQLGLALLAFFAHSELWDKPTLLLPLAVTWELGGLAALAVNRVLPKHAELEAGFQLYLLSILGGAVAHSVYHALHWEDWTSWLRLLLLGPLAGGGAALVSGMLTSMLLEYGFKKTATRFVKVVFMSRETMGKMEGTQEHIWRVVEARFGVKRIDVPSELWSAVKEAEDLKQLSQWFDVALTAESFEAFRAAILPGSDARPSKPLHQSGPPARSFE